MDSKLEAHIDEIFQDIPKTDKLVTMINRIKSKANAKYLQIRDQGYSRSVAFTQVDDWLMKAKIIVDEEVGKLTPAEIAAIPKAEDTPGMVVSSASMDNGELGEVYVEREEPAPYMAPDAEPAFGTPYGDAADVAPAYEAPQDVAPEAVAAAPVEEAPKAKKEKAPKANKGKKGKKGKKNEVEEEEVEVPIAPTGKFGKIVGAICLVGGVALIVVAVLLLLNLIP